jgi:hypothetical protein
VIVLVTGEQVGIVDQLLQIPIGWQGVPVLADKEWAWMAVSEGVRWCTRHPATDTKCQAEHPVLTNRERL